MAGFLNRLRPHGLMLWMTLSILLLFGVLFTAIDYSHLSNAESRRANAVGQRVIVDPLTGNVSLASAPSVKEAFDVGQEPATAAAVTTAAEETPAKEAMPVGDEPAAPTNASLPADMPQLRTEPLKTETPEISNSKESLVPAPAPEITEILNGTPLPKQGLNDSSPSKIYAQPFTRNSKQEMLSIVVLNAGISSQADGLILALPRGVSVAFSPYGSNTKTSLTTLRKAGFEAWAILPTMGEHFPQDDPGPLGLVASLPKDELLRRAREVMSATLGAVGLILPPDETITAKQTVFGNILTDITSRGLYLLSTHPTHALSEVTKDEKLQASVQRADIIVDPQPDEAQIQSKLAAIPAALHKKGSLIVVVSSRPQSLVLLQHWLKENPLAEPAVLAPLSAQWQPKEAPAPAEAKKEEKHEEKKPEEKKSEKSAEPEKKAEGK